MIKAIVLAGDGFFNCMEKPNAQFYRWIPTLVVMAVIFWFSSRTSAQLPNFGLVDKIVKKGGHMIGYALLALSYWYALKLQKNTRWFAWMLAVLYAMTDEFHQRFVSGRHPTIWDVVVFDNLGALISLWIAGRRIKQ